MFDFLNKQAEDRPQDVKILRDRLLQFIKQQLSKVQGGEGANIKGLHIFLTATEAEKHLYESAIYLEDEERFKSEIQKIADDFAIDLPANWTLETTFVQSPPPEAINAPNMDAAIFIQTKKRTIQRSATAYIRVLNGEAEQEIYTITSSAGKVNIGREKKVQTEDGFFRTNHISFPGESDNEANKFISRQHAHIEWDNDSGTFLLFADEGGLPPRNKIKVRSINGIPVKLQTDKVGHQLLEGDQIMIGQMALLEFSYSNEG